MSLVVTRRLKSKSSHQESIEKNVQFNFFMVLFSQIPFSKCIRKECSFTLKKGGFLKSPMHNDYELKRGKNCNLAG